MRSFVKLFFTLLLVGSVSVFAISTISSPVLAEESPIASETPATPTEETPTEETPDTTEDSDGGEEWDGIIKDPISTSTPEPTSDPTPVVITEVVTTVTPPRTSYDTPKTTTAETKTPETTPGTESEPEEAPTSTTDEIKVEVLETEAKAKTEAEAPVDIPSTATPTDDTARKISLLALISTTIVYFSAIEFWSLKQLIKIKKNEKLLKSATKKSLKGHNISRAS